MTGCTIEGENQALLKIGNSIAQFSQVYLEISGVLNPASTALNKDYQVSTFNASGITIEMAGNLNLVQFQPAALTEFAFLPESDRFGAKTSVVITLALGVNLPCSFTGTDCYLTVEAPVLNSYSTSRDRDIVFDEELLSCEVISEVSRILHSH